MKTRRIYNRSGSGIKNVFQACYLRNNTFLKFANESSEEKLEDNSVNIRDEKCDLERVFTFIKRWER